MNFIQIPKPALTGIVLPSFFRNDFESDTPTNNHLKWLKDFVNANNLRIEWHDFVDADYYQKELESNDTAKKETVWSTIDQIASDFDVILHRAKLNRYRFEKGLITAQERHQASPPAQVATAAVKLAIKNYMQDLSQNNYTTKYNAALNAAKKYYSETIKDGKLTNKPNKQLEDLFNYYCPDPPVAEAEA